MQNIIVSQGLLIRRKNRQTDQLSAKVSVFSIWKTGKERISGKAGLLASLILFTFFCLGPWEYLQAGIPNSGTIYHHADSLKSDDRSTFPVVIGYGEGLFKVGELLYWDDFRHLNNWRFQVQASDHETVPEIVNMDGELDIFMPARGATVWFQHKLFGPVAIVYQVKLPVKRYDHPWSVPRDVNTFWHASDPQVPWNIFDDEQYTGSFSTYHEQKGYYASMGGRENSTTRFRRYPRNADGFATDHISLSDRDGIDDFLIQPDQIHTIQLVAYDDVVQYIVDGKVAYEIREGDIVTIERENGEVAEIEYTLDRFPVYSEGWFGFRMVRSHHIYSNFRVYQLEPH